MTKSGKINSFSEFELMFYNSYQNKFKTAKQF